MPGPKEVGDLTAASALDGTETVHVVQSGNSRRATAADIARSSVQVDTYGLGDVDVDGNLYIDIADCNSARIFGTVSLDASARPNVYLAEDGVLEDTAGSYIRFNRSGTGTASLTTANGLFTFGDTDSTSDLYGFIDISGHNTANKTYYRMEEGNSNDFDTSFGWLDNTNTQNQIAFVPASGAFDAVDLTVFKY